MGGRHTASSSNLEALALLEAEIDFATVCLPLRLLFLFSFIVFRLVALKTAAQLLISI